RAPSGRANSKDLPDEPFSRSGSIRVFALSRFRARMPESVSPAGRIRSRRNAAMTKPAPLSVSQLVAIFVRTGSLAFGGGASTLAMLHDEFCVRRPIVSEEEFQVLWGLTRLLPGMNLLSLTVMLGYRTAGLMGSFLALAGLTIPSFVI